MKSRISLTTLLILFSISLINAQNAKFSFSETTHDFGTISANGGIVTHDFTITNNSKEPLVINNVNTTCGCTTPNYTKSPIEPGASGVISVSFFPAGYKGNVSKSIKVKTNLSSDLKILTIKANVVTEDVDYVSVFPVVIGNLRLKEMPALDFSQIDLGGNKVKTIKLYNDSETEITDYLVLPPYITVTPTSLPPKKESNVYITFNTSEYKELGIVNGTIPFGKNTNYKGKDAITYKGFVKENFDNATDEQKAKSPKLNTNKREFTFSDKVNLVSIKLANSGKSDLNIKAIQSNNKDITFSQSKLVIKPGEIADIKMNYPSNKMKNANATSKVYILSDDIKNPVTEINIIVSK
ncbi:hypothetical protein M2138_000722 [Dysgonomonadaceae bacterium PH5-43]|nr:hypothetical protein [Dysgonomonadaceae bacterium PH5-43]